MSKRDSLQPIIFLGISDVLMPEPRWFSEENSEALAARQSGTWQGIQQALERVSFDQQGVRRLVGLVLSEDARLVVASCWRNKVGHGSAGNHRLVHKLIDQGISLSAFHTDAVVPWRSIREPQPLHDIRLWLERHSHVRPEDHSGHTPTSNGFIDACAVSGFPFITLDTDERLPNVAVTDEHLGLTDDAVSRAHQAIAVQREWLATHDMGPPPMCYESASICRRASYLLDAWDLDEGELTRMLGAPVPAAMDAWLSGNHSWPWQDDVMSRLRTVCLLDIELARLLPVVRERDRWPTVPQPALDVRRPLDLLLAGQGQDVLQHVRALTELPKAPAEQSKASWFK